MLSLGTPLFHRSLEEALVSALVEARRAAPAVLYLPQLHLWWAAAPPLLRTTLACLLRELPPSLPLLLLATAEAGTEELLGGLGGSSSNPGGGSGVEEEQEEEEGAGVTLWGLFPPGEALVVELGLPGEEQRRSMFQVRPGSAWSNLLRAPACTLRRRRGWSDESGSATEACWLPTPQSHWNCS